MQQLRAYLLGLASCSYVIPRDLWLRRITFWCSFKSVWKKKSLKIERSMEAEVHQQHAVPSMSHPFWVWVGQTFGHENPKTRSGQLCFPTFKDRTVQNNLKHSPPPLEDLGWLCCIQSFSFLLPRVPSFASYVQKRKEGNVGREFVITRQFWD